MERKKSVFDDNGIVFIISFVLAFMLWVIATSELDPNSTVLQRNIPISVDSEYSQLVKLGLNVIEEEQQYANVEIEGARAVIGNLTNSAIKISADLSSVTAPGVYEINLVAEDVNGLGFQVLDIEPSTIELKFDRLDSKSFPVTIESPGIEIPDGYYLQEEIIIPGEITVTGPEVDLEKVWEVVAVLDVERTLTTTGSFQGSIEIRDRDGNVIDNSHLSTDYSVVDITLPVLKIQEIPLSISFLNLPSSFPEHELRYNISNETILLAGPADRIDDYSEINLGYVDMKNLLPTSTFAYDISLPSDFVNIENIQTVLVEFTMDDLTTKDFDVDNLVVVNQPANYDITVTTKSLPNVTMVGDQELLDSLTSSDIVAEVNISGSNLSVGQIQVPVSITAPNKGLVWANGNYQAIVTIEEK